MFRKHLIRLLMASLAVWLGSTWGSLGTKTSAAEDTLGIYPMRLPAAGSLEMVTRVDLKRSLELAGANLMANLDPKRHYLPNWDVRPAKDGTAAVNPGWPGHNLGRWWDAMMRLQEAIGYPIPAEAEAAMQQNVFRFFNNPDHLCLAPFDMEGVNPQFDLHSLREGLLALNALVQYRQNKQAAQQGHAMIESLLRLPGEDGSWKLQQCDYARRVGLETAPRPTGG